MQSREVRKIMKLFPVTGKFNCPLPVLCFEEQAAINNVDAVAERLYQEKNPQFFERFYQ